MGYVVSMFAGSFDPPTNGHLDIIRKAAGIFDKLYVVICINPDKQCLFSMEERFQMLSECLDELKLTDVELACWDGLTVDFAKQHNVDVLIRGVRNTADFEYEYDMAVANNRLCSNIQTVFIPADPYLVEVRSSAVKTERLKSAELEKIIPLPVIEKVRRKIGAWRNRPEGQ